MSAAAFLLLQHEIVRCSGRDSALSHVVGHDGKGRLSLALYAVAILVATWLLWLSCLLYATVAAIWLIPDRRFASVARH